MKESKPKTYKEILQFLKKNGIDSYQAMVATSCDEAWKTCKGKFKNKPAINYEMFCNTCENLWLDCDDDRGLTSIADSVAEYLVNRGRFPEDIIDILDGDYYDEDDDNEEEEDPPYDEVTYEKKESLGKTMTVKEACDLWWNSIRIRVYGDVICVYKCCDGDYDVYGLWGDPEDDDGILAKTEKEALAIKITLDDDWTEDSDGYPIVFASLAVDGTK